MLLAWSTSHPLPVRQESLTYGRRPKPGDRSLKNSLAMFAGELLQLPHFGEHRRTVAARARGRVKSGEGSFRGRSIARRTSITPAGCRLCDLRTHKRQLRNVLQLDRDSRSLGKSRHDFTHIVFRPPDRESSKPRFQIHFHRGGGDRYCGEKRVAQRYSAAPSTMSSCRRSVVISSRIQ